MRLLILFLLLSSVTWSKPTSASKTLDNYISMLSSKDVNLINDIFTRRYLKEIGGKKKIISLMNKKNLFVPKKYFLKSKKSHRMGIYFVNLIYTNKFSKMVSTWFRLVQTKDGKVKIDGLASDM